VGMEMKIVQVVLNLQCLIIFLSFFFSFNLYRLSWKNGIKYFSIYHFVAFVIAIPFFLMFNGLSKILHLHEINNYSLLFGFLFLSLFMIFNMPNKKGRGLLIALFMFLFSLLIFNILIKEADKSIQNYQAFAINCFGLLVFSIIYFFKLFKVIPEIRITSDPNFWVIIGVFSCSIMSSPIFIVTGFFYKIDPENRILILIGLLPSLGFTTLHLFLIKAILCTKKLQ
jgi:hypothetical protein